MVITVDRVEFKEVEALRGLYRHEAGCQIVRDSLLGRGLADPYLILADGRIAGYGAVRTKYDPGRIMEFYTVPELRHVAARLFRELLGTSRATEIEAQTNMPLMLTMLYDCAADITQESILFHDVSVTRLTCPAGTFRRAEEADAASMFPHRSEPEGDWIVEVNGDVAATGGFLCHYNPPYGDIYMEVAEPSRRNGIGSFLVQEVKRVCYEAGKKPAARCDPANVASRRTLEKAGFLPCGRIMVGKVAF